MGKQAAEYVVLCEDKLQAIFVRNYLKEKGIATNRIRVLPVPSGEGSGVDFVLSQFPVQVAAYRKATAKRSAALIVVIDADQKSVHHRLAQFDRILEQGGHRSRIRDEKIGIFVPKRHIETWIRYALGLSVDEEEDYHSFERTKKEEIVPHVRRLAREICRAPLPDNAPPSLAAACDEVRRIF